MNLADNLKKIRKDNNLSQEDLAEKLGVSRQSVSKWESNQAYPEMDKVLQICKMFNVKLDDLLNNDIHKLEKEKKSKVNINKYADDFLGFFTKTIDMFTNMRIKDIIKCAVEQIILVLILSIILKIFGGIINDVIREILFFFNDKVYNVFYQIFSSLYYVLSVIVITVIVIHIFKIRYLDYYKVEKKKDNDNKEKQEELKDNKIENKKNEKIVIRDPEHSGDKFISALFKVLLIMLKIFLLSFVAFLCFTFIGFVICFVVSFMFIKTGTFFMGMILSILACLLVVYIFLDLLYHFYINTKPKFAYLGIMFLSSLIIFGIGCGLLIYNIPKFNVIGTDNKKYYITEEKTYQMKADMVIKNYGYNIKYKEIDTNDVIIKCKHPKVYKVSFNNDNNHISVDRYIISQMDLLKDSINNLNHKMIVNYDNIDITVYTSKENIETLKENQNNLEQNN